MFFLCLKLLKEFQNSTRTHHQLKIFKETAEKIFRSAFQEILLSAALNTVAVIFTIEKS